MIAWLIYQQEDAHENRSYINWFIEEAQKQSIDLQLIDRENLHIGIIEQKNVVYVNGIMLEELPDFVIVRTIEPMLQIHFEAMGIQTFNNSFVSIICNDKARTYNELHQLDIPMMSTIYLPQQHHIPSIPPFGFPFVVKEVSGRGGKGVCFIKNKDEWQEYHRNTKNRGHIIQSAEHIQLGKDVRVFVIGKEIIAAVLRHNKNDFRANYKLGGSASLFKLTDDMKIMIQKIIDHFDFDMVGIDFLINKDQRLIFNEIEDVVGSRILSKTTHINLLEKYIIHILHQLKKKRPEHN